MYALFSYAYFRAKENNCVAAMELCIFIGCVASAAHFFVFAALGSISSIKVHFLKIADGLKRESETVMKKIIVFITLILALIMCMASCDLLSSLGSKEPVDDIVPNEPSSESEHTHEFGEWFITETPTCTNVGVKVGYCSCGEEQILSIPELPHDVVIVESVAPTCLTIGFTEGKYCSVCNEVLVEQATIDLIEHNFTDMVVTPPTCTEPSIGKKTCLMCNIEYNEIISPALGHTKVMITAVNPTCTDIGFSESIYCTECDEIFVPRETVAELGHNYVDGTCTRCESTKYVRCDKYGTPNDNGEYILFGEYPQTIKSNDVTITSTQDNRGYYLGSDGYYYAAVTATPYGSGYTFSNNATVVSGTVYYFKVEPIRWRILSTDGETAFILCDSVIAGMDYQSNYTYDNSTYEFYTTANGALSGTYANNYKYSDVRAWLNSIFYATAFTELQREIILTTNIDNSAYGIASGTNSYAYEDTKDKIFLLSHSEATNSEYGFSSDESEYDVVRRMQTSDYSRATGVFMCTWSSYYGNAIWWLRSPDGYFTASACNVGYDGYVNGVDYVNSTYGVVPALWIEL